MNYKGWKIKKRPNKDPATGWPIGDPVWKAERFGVEMQANSKGLLLEMIDLHNKAL